MSEIIMENKGFIDKYEWDSIMALFWIFWKTAETKTFDIIQSAISQQKKLKELNKEFKEILWEELKVRMWIHCWEAIIWNIWAKWKKMEFTALWDNINLASRLEWVNKFYNTYICCSENIYQEQKENFCFRFLDNIKVKWKYNWVKIYELLWKKWEITEKQKEIKKIFEEALKYYFKKDFKKAIELFKKSEKIWDKTSTIFIFRCEYLLKNPVKENWNWIWEMKEK
jgi:adenylate cyclase